MNVSSFLKESSRKIKPDLFLQENDSFLRNLRECLIPKSALQDQTEKDQKAYQKTQETINYILGQVKKRAMMPTPALTQIGMLLLTLPNPPPARKGKPCDPSKQRKGGVMIDSDGNELIETKEERAERTTSRYTLLMYVGELEYTKDPKNAPTIKSMRMVEEQFKEKTFQEAERKAHRLLFKHEDSLEVHIICSDGVITKVCRGEAMAAILGKPKSPICKPQVKSSKHGYGVRSKAYKIHFSHG